MSNTIALPVLSDAEHKIAHEREKEIFALYFKCQFQEKDVSPEVLEVRSRYEKLLDEQSAFIDKYFPFF